MITARSHRFGNGLGDLRKKGVCKIRQQQADGVRAASNQTSRHQIRPVIQFFGALEHPIPSARADSALVAQDFGDGDDRNLQVFGDVGKRSHFCAE